MKTLDIMIPRLHKYFYEHPKVETLSLAVGVLYSQSYGSITRPDTHFTLLPSVQLKVIISNVCGMKFDLVTDQFSNPVGWCCLHK